jgi:CRP-like cAMP-binding protein
MAQTEVCNRHHTADQQLARWLLLPIDRLPHNTLMMTQELIADMLGMRREEVTDGAGKLQKLSVIMHSRGTITVLDRPPLESLSCVCYGW